MHAAGITCSQRLGDITATPGPAGEAGAVALLDGQLAKLEARMAYGFRNPLNQRRRVRPACIRGTRRRSRTSTTRRTRLVTRTTT